MIEIFICLIWYLIGLKAAISFVKKSTEGKITLFDCFMISICSFAGPGLYLGFFMHKILDKFENSSFGRKIIWKK